ncbi:MAG: L,D-transpeptidase family protein [Legionellales bacterium]|nr:L,D-transpeptidase family protein [Legionellales bacterium]
MRILGFIILLAILLTGCHGVPKKKVTTNNWQQAQKQILQQYGARSETRLKSYFKQAGVRYPPKKVNLLVFKKERKVELWAQDHRRQNKLIRTYPMTATSGLPGPKMRQWDKQIPEGIYNIVYLNPFSEYHLSMMLNYPNQFDREKARLDGRTNLGDEIFIHGKRASAGCIAVGDRAMNELFVLMSRVGARNAQVIIAPNDLRKRKPFLDHKQPKPNWLPELYTKINRRLQSFHTTVSA